MSEKNIEWNIGSHRIEFIGELTTQVRIKFNKAVSETTKGNVRNYLNALETLWFDIRNYVNDDREKVDQKLEDIRKMIEEGEDPSTILKEIKDIDKKINNERINLGLDIPSKDAKEEGHELL